MFTLCWYYNNIGWVTTYPSYYKLKTQSNRQTICRTWIKSDTRENYYYERGNKIRQKHLIELHNYDLIVFDKNYFKV